MRADETSRRLRAGHGGGRVDGGVGSPARRSCALLQVGGRVAILIRFLLDRGVALVPTLRRSMWLAATGGRGGCREWTDRCEFEIVAFRFSWKELPVKYRADCLGQGDCLRCYFSLTFDIELL